MAKSSQVSRALDIFGDELTKKRNVVGLGKVPSETASGEWDLAVYVERKVPDRELPKGDRVPKRLTVPGGVVTTQVIEQGVVELEEL